tara:strand:- start:11413 stop:12111 length:699 start_codon:yes stop_codon:yes gene_type:complete
MKNNVIKKKLEYLFKILDSLGISDLTANHASILDDKKNGFFTNQHKFLFSQINSKNLVHVKLNDNFSSKYKIVNKAGFYIHKYLHNSKAKPEAILHTHSVNAVAISCLKKGFDTKLNQSSMRFYNKIKYFNYGNMIIDDKEGKKLGKLVERNTKLIILKNHGIIILGDTIEELFHLTFHFEKCADIQLKIMGEKSKNLVSNKTAVLTSKQHLGFGPVGGMSWNAAVRQLKRK